ncbi:mannose-1-phosphate guanyltransferase [Enorma massiliensis]|uniref:sugar phosphate nucleotidyltransferase n=1 Tax=Enorma massiliensis TaxID=1472761 RepID=UPI00195D358A|nr:sugar phosphate nucleotidyltransferase [Enorma massiliensis]MBM6892860.1 mannose-1-phosphate guanyltransferase [Enorma massiliensis]
MSKLHIVLLSGGSGSRLWPLSNETRSKQFLKVLRDENGEHVSMVQRVFGQISRMVPDADITVATGVSQVRSLEMQVKGRYAEVVEPERRDTAPAIMLACEHLASEQGARRDDTVVVMPIDPYVEDGYFAKVLEISQAVQTDAADMVLLGVEPTYPSEKYGYIVSEQTGDAPVRKVSRFTEKPDEVTARELIAQGALWNCGVFGFRLGYALGILARYGSFSSYEDLRSRYAELPKNSFDYEVVERAESVAVIPYAGDWKDLGTWNTLTEEMKDPYSGRVVVDDSTCSGVHVVNETGLPLVVAGLTDSVVVATPDGILVSGKKESAAIKSLVGQAAESQPMYEKCPWGEYRVVDLSSFPNGTSALTRELIIREGKQLEYQRQTGCSVVWTVLSGQGEVVIEERLQEVAAGSVVCISTGQAYAAKATASDLFITEVQLGRVLAKEDTEELELFWDENQ